MSAFDPKRTLLPKSDRLLKTGVILNLTTEGYVRRRDFIKGVAGSTVVWPLAARAQQPALPVVGFVNFASAKDWAPQSSAFLKGLSEAGYVDGRNVVVETHWADGRIDRLPAIIADLVHRQVAVTSTEVAIAAKAANTIIPIVFETASDPVQLGLVAHLNRPGSNVTGITSVNVEMAPKRLQLLHELVPTASIMALLVNPANPRVTETNIKLFQMAARALGLELHVLNASTEREFDGVFAKLIQLRAGGLVIGPDTYFTGQNEQLAALTVRHAVPAIYQFRRCWRSAELRRRHYGGISPSRYLCRSGSQGRKTCRPTGSAGHQGRAVHQPEDRQGSRHHHSEHATRARERGVRIETLFVTMSPLLAQSGHGDRAQRCPLLGVKWTWRIYVHALVSR
jgi:putative tryptophan/tyrosine transport system substrate-binding protein